MRAVQVRRCWELMMLGLALAAIGTLCLALFGCGDAPQPEQQEPMPAETVYRAPVIVEDDLPEYTEQERAAMAEFMRTVEPSDREVMIDDPELYAARPKAFSGEKAQYPAVTGWGMYGHLAYQDGTNTEGWIEGDHCALFGLDCDDEWHAQAAELYLDGSARDVYNALRNGCGSGTVESDGQSNLWLPCIGPYLTQSHREITVYFDEPSCPSNTAGRKAIRDAINSVMSYMNRYSSVRLLAGRLNDADIIVYCDETLEADTAAMWLPAGNLSLRYGSIKGPADLTVLTYEQCETRGLPGYGRGGRNYQQGVDMMYSYSYANIALHWSAQFEKIAQCTSDPTEVSRVWRNTILHEVGHHLGFHHEAWDDDDFGVMATGGIACERLAGWSRGFDDNHLAAILDWDMDPSSGDVTIWDEDISCYNPAF